MLCKIKPNIIDGKEYFCWPASNEEGVVTDLVSCGSVVLLLEEIPSRKSLDGNHQYCKVLIVDRVLYIKDTALELIT